MSAGTRTWSFDTDLSADPELIVLGNNDQPWQAASGNPGGFYAMNYAQNGQNSGILFPNIDPGMIVTGFLFECDVRAGNSSGDRPADGFSLSFARSDDPVLAGFASGSLSGFAGNGPAEFGSGTGIAISFDTWSGNALPDGADIEGIIVRVDNVTVLRQALPTRHGACDDITSLQTGPRDAAYWTGGGDARAPEAWAGLCWQPFSVQVAENATVTVKWKGTTILDAFQSSYFPSAGQLVFAGRTGDANMNAHIDNVKLTTTAADGGALPSVPGNARTTQVGSRRVALAWDASTIPGGGNVAYEISRNGVVIAATVTTTTYDDRGLSPNTAYTYAIRAKNIAGNLTDPANVNATTVADVDQLGVANYQIWANIAGTAVDAGLFDLHYSDPADRSNFANGIEVGTPPTYGGNPEGDNYLGVMKAVVTVPETGSYRFFIASDDASNLYIDGTPVPPDPLVSSYVAQETACCNPFQELQDDGFGGVITPPQVTEPIALTAGQQLGVTAVWKEGGGGDGVGVAWRREGDTTPASSLVRIGGGFVTGKVDPVGSTVTITQQPVAQTVTASSPLTLTVGATGTSPYSGSAVFYHWYKNNVPLSVKGGLAGFNPFGATLTIPFAAAGDAGTYKVLAYVMGQAVFSDEVTVTVNADTVAPTIVSTKASDSFNQVTVTFSEPVTEASAGTVGNYAFTGGLTVSAVEVIDPLTVRLTTSVQTPGSVYPLRVTGVRDQANLASDSTADVHAFILLPGRVLYSTWQNQTGAFGTWISGGVQNLPPTTSNLINSYLSNTADQFENYFGQVKGLFIPPQNGNYVFWVASDDLGEVYLSTDANPANKVLIAREPVWGGRRYWQDDGTAANNSASRGTDGTLSNRSDQFLETQWAGGPGAPITLVGGQQYYLELLYKEGGGGDHGAVAVTLEGAAAPGNGANELGGDQIGVYVDPREVPPDAPVITLAPVGATVAPGADVTLTAEATHESLPVTYQWYRNNKAIAGATSATLQLNDVTVANIGDYRVTASVERNGLVSSASSDDNFGRVLLTGAYVIEAEDYNHGGGQTIAAASTMPLTSGLYEGLDGIQGVDMNTLNSAIAADLEGNAYRNGWVNAGTPVEPPSADANVQIALDNGGGGPEPQNRARPDFELTNNYKVGWGDAGEWFQYTRDFPEGEYAAVFVGSHDGRTVNGYTKTLELVTGNITQPDAATFPLGEAVYDGTGGWSSNDHIPFLIPGSPAGSSALATFTLGPGTTLRLRHAVGDGDLDAILFYKVEGGPQPLVDVTSPADTIVGFGGTSPAGEPPANAFNNDTTKYLNFGDGDTAAPFVGPVGVTVTPAAGASVVSGIRFYNANDAEPRDPADYILEGSNDGTTFTQIATGALALPAGRNAAGQALDLALAHQEVQFANSTAYRTYRITFTNVKDNAAANSMQIGEIELLGTVVGGGEDPTLSAVRNADGSITLTFTGVLEVADSPAGPYVAQPAITSPYTFTPGEGAGAQFARSRN